jgi:hypothetical protein
MVQRLTANACLGNYHTLQAIDSLAPRVAVPKLA